MEGQRTLVNWGVKRTQSHKKAETLSKVQALIQHYRPRTLILENGNAKGTRRCERVRRLLTDIRAMAEKKRVETRSVSPLLVKEVFLAFRAKTKHQIAQVIATQLPELAARLPRQRKLWMPEDYRMSIFDATALALTYFYTHPSRQGSVHKF